jgi:hypothetical protein
VMIKQLKWRGELIGQEVLAKRNIQ